MRILRLSTLSLVWAIAVISLGNASPAFAAKPNCDGMTPDHASCKPKPGDDDSGDGKVIFDAKLIGNGADFPDGIQDKTDTNCGGGTTGPTVFFGSEPNTELHEFVKSYLDDQAFGIGTGGLGRNSDRVGVNFFNTTTNGPGGSNHVTVQGGDGECDGNDPITGHLDVGFSIDRTKPCDNCVWLVDFRGGTVMSNEKYASCAAVSITPVELSLAAKQTTTIDLFLRCDIIRQGKRTKQGTLSWGQVELTPRP